MVFSALSDLSVGMVKRGGGSTSIWALDRVTAVKDGFGRSALFPAFMRVTRLAALQAPAPPCQSMNCLVMAQVGDHCQTKMSFLGGSLPWRSG